MKAIGRGVCHQLAKRSTHDPRDHKLSSALFARQHTLYTSAFSCSSGTIDLHFVVAGSKSLEYG